MYCQLAKMSEPIPTLEAMEKTTKHKGHAYNCMRCSRMGKGYVDVKPLMRQSQQKSSAFLVC